MSRQRPFLIADLFCGAGAGSTEVVSWRDCDVCGGLGLIEVCRNDRGEIDYLYGHRTGAWVTCDYCQGSGLEPDELAGDDIATGFKTGHPKRRR